jgi:hypothetical protein
MTATTARFTPPRLVNELPAGRCRAYELLAMAVVKRTVAQYACHTQSCACGHSPGRVDPKSWKLLKKHETVKIYQSREKPQPVQFVDSGDRDCPQQPTQSQWAPSAKLLCVGTLPGTLEDAMLGTVTPTELSMASRSLAIQDEFIRHRVLQDIKVPTQEEPFKYLGLKWAMRSSSLRSIVRARDLVFVEASGFQYITLNHSHERIGYTLCHTVEIPELQPATTKGVTRAKFSMCSVYRQREPGIVDVFVTLMSDPGGRLPHKLAAQSAANALIAAAKLMDCAVERKLEWMLKSNYTASVSPDGECIAVAKAHGSHWCCMRCTRNLSSFASLGACGVCHSTVCLRCLTPRKLVVGSSPRDLRRKTFQVCTGCIASAQRGMDTTQVAVDEFARSEEAKPAAVAQHHAAEPLPKRVDLVCPSPSEMSDTSTCTTSTCTTSTCTTSSSFIQSVSQVESTAHADPIVLYEEKSDTRHYHSSQRSIRSMEPLTKSLHLEDLAMLDDPWTEDEDEDVIDIIEPLSPAALERLRLEEQMNDLRELAEETFRMTKRQTRTIQRSKLEVHVRYQRRAMSKSAIY